MLGSNANPPVTLDPTFDLLRLAFHEEPYTLSPLEGPYGYFPMRLGQKLRQGKYEIVRKLGYGTNSSVWLAKETTCVPSHSRRPRTDCRLAFSRPDGHRYIVLKIMSVYATHVEIRQLSHEAAVARSMVTFQKSDQAHPGYRHCAMIGRTFFENSAHGEHLCSLYAPYGTTLDDLLETSPTGRLPLPAVKTITRQVLLALSFLEYKLQRVHTGQSSPRAARHMHSRTSQTSRRRTFSTTRVSPLSRSTASSRTARCRCTWTRPRSIRAYRPIPFRPCARSRCPTLGSTRRMRTLTSSSSTMTVVCMSCFPRSAVADGPSSSHTRGGYSRGHTYLYAD